jgi:hypothetical protein
VARAAKVIALHSFDDDEALMYLSDVGRVEMNLSDLAQQFGWTLTKLRRSLSAWVKAGHITQASGGRGKVVVTALRTSQQVAAQLVDRAFRIEMPKEPAPVKPVRSLIATLTSIVLFSTAVGLTGVGLIMNARFAASFGQTVEAGVLLATIGLAVDMLAVVLPTVGVQLWQRRSILAAGAAWTIWMAALTMTMLAATGFASTNIGDAVAGRAKIAGESTALTERIGRLRSERAGITETRSTAAIDVELQRAQPEAQAVWRATNGCRDVTRMTSGRACATVLELREALATAERRDGLDTELRAAESRLASLPAVMLADPQATTAAEILAWLTGGAFKPAPSDISRLRALGLALTPSLAGLLAMLAISLTHARRTDTNPSPSS